MHIQCTYTPVQACVGTSLLVKLILALTLQSDWVRILNRDICIPIVLVQAVRQTSGWRILSRLAWMTPSMTFRTWTAALHHHCPGRWKWTRRTSSLEKECPWCTMCAFNNWLSTSPCQYHIAQLLSVVFQDHTMSSARREVQPSVV